MRESPSRFAVARATLTVTLLTVAWVSLVVAAPGMGDPETFGASRLRDQRVFPPLWKKTPSGRWRPTDKRLANRSFPSHGSEPGLVRVFVLGESTVAGLGLSENASFPRALERRLEAARARAGGGPFAVVNAGILGLAAKQVSLVEKDAVRARREESAQGRDVFVFQVGNTEFLELMALKILERRGGETAAMKLDRTLERFRLYALLKGSAPSVWKALTPRVPFESPLEAEAAPVTSLERAAIALGYASELRRMVESARAAGATPVLATVPVNLEWDGGPPPAHGLLADACDAPIPDEPAARKALLEATLAKLDERIARAHERGDGSDRGDRVKRAHVLRGLGEAALAWGELVALSDEDPRLLRCLSSMNAEVRKVARETGAPLADAELALMKAADDRIPGFRFFLDNAHLTPEGAERVAEELHRALAEAGLAPALDDPGWVERRMAALANAREDSLSVREWLGWNDDRSLISRGSMWKLEQARRVLDERIARGEASAEELVWAANGYALRVGGEARARELYEKARAAKPELADVVSSNLAWLDAEER